MLKTYSISAACLLALVASARAEKQPYSRYQSIVDRQMFGQPPAGFDPSKMPSEVSKTKDAEVAKQEAEVKKAIRFSVINVTADGETVVGFSDNGDPKNPLHYYLKVGESQNGWTVKAANPETATMTIEKDGIEVSLKLGGDSATAADAVSRVGANSTASTLDLQPSRTSSLRAKRREREEAAEAKRAAEEKERSEREARRDQMQSELLSELQKLKEEQRQAREAAQANESEKSADSTEGNPETAE